MATPAPSPSAPVDTVIFDLGNVLIPWDRRFLYEKLIDDRDELDRFLDDVLTLDANADLDRGTPLPEVVAGLIELHPDHADLLQAFADRWIETVGPAIEGSVRLLERLVAAGVPCYALSNFGRDTFEQTEGRFPFLDRFEGRLISGYEGVVKPEPEIFHLLCRRFGLRAERSLFIDDSAANVAAARDLGFAVHHFADPEALEADLVARALLPATAERA
ncbi:MAG: HAD family phosphatase [Actinomycetota bacterium]